MTPFWALAAALTAAALAFLLPPLLRRRTTAPDVRIGANAAIYREQLEELAAELRRGATTKEEFERGSREIEHRIVAEHADSAPQPATRRPLAAALALSLLLPIGVVLGYLQLGNPGALSATAESTHQFDAAQLASLVARLEARLQQAPEDAEGWILLGRSYGAMEQYDRAAKAYTRASQLVPGDAGLLADYADTLAMAQGRKLDGAPFELVKRALAIEPRHLKALALAGAAEYERRNFAAAIGYWQRVLEVAPPQSDFARAVTESIAEARSLGGSALASKAAPAKGKKSAKGNQSLQGIVSIAPDLASKLAPGDTVFVLARPVSGSRMPLAVARTTVAALPYRFTLDDSMAMAPGATLSSHAQVVVAARVSKSGNAAPQKGDIEGVSAPVAPGATGVRVVISRTLH